MKLGRWFWNPLFAVVLLSICSVGGTPSKVSEADLAAISESGILLAGAGRLGEAAKWTTITTQLRRRASRQPLER